MELLLAALVVGLLLVGGVLVVSYNQLVGLRQLVRNSWADVDVYLKRRAELIPNLVTAVKAYATHEQALLTSIAEARAQATALQGPSRERISAEGTLAAGVLRIVALAEAYPDLKASGNFQDLQKELSETERLIASARQYYNAVVRDYNIKIEAFPSNVVAGVGGFKQAEFFEVSSVGERSVPGVQ